MADDQYPYSDEELDRYFNDPDSRHSDDADAPGGTDRASRRTAGANAGKAGFLYKNRLRTYYERRFDDPKKTQAAYVLSLLLGLVLVGVVLVTLFFFVFLVDDLPATRQLENPSYQLATVAYTADGQVLARYALQNRSWATYDEISPHVINALLATEDRRFYEHWGIDARGIMAAVRDAFVDFDLRGASTISQQLARNLYNKEIGREVTVGRKLKEMVTAVRLERRYTKREIIEMYLNTVEYVYNAFGIEAAAQTFFGTSADSLDALQSATLVGMLQNPSLYNPIRFPENAQRRRNVVLQNMVREGHLTSDYYAAHRDEPVEPDFHSSSLEASLAPYFAEYVRNWMREWSRENDRNFYEEGLRVYTTLDSELQELANAAVKEQGDRLQAVVDYEWSRSGNYYLGGDTDLYVGRDGYEPFEYYWSSQRNTVDAFIRETSHFASLREQDMSAEEALAQLRGDEAFMDSLKTAKTRLEAGLVSIDPRTGHVRAWVGGRDFVDDKYDKVAIAERQPGSTFKPFVYTAAIDNGYSPYYALPDSTLSYRTETGEIWSPGNFGGTTGEMKTLTEGLANSLNTITARVITELVTPQTVAFYARRMGVRKSKLDPVPALALGTSDVTLLEMGSAYATLANGGLYNAPTVVTRIEDRNGNVLYEAQPTPEEALPEASAYTVVDMMRGVVDYGTGIRMRTQWGMNGYDLAAKTGTTQEAADGWFMLMHPDLVTGAWVGFNDRRVTFRSNFWGQGAHNALFIVGDYYNRIRRSDAVELSASKEFPLPENYGAETQGGEEDDSGNGRVGW